MRQGNEGRWAAAFSAASRLAPPDAWRGSLARALREAAQADLSLVITCPPGDWGRHFQSTTYPDDHAGLARVAQGFLPQIEACGEGFAYAIVHHGLVYAPLDVARNRPLAEAMKQAVLAPAGLRGWVATSIVDDTGQLIGTIVLGTRREAPRVLEEAGAELRDLSAVAARTLGGAIQLAAACLPPATAAPSSALAHLTTRERQIAALVAEGLRNANIAARLGIADTTVAVHLKRIYGKLGIASRVDLAMLARG
jgi:DNA-binding CsgD family transcriptional regulator